MSFEDLLGGDGKNRNVPGIPGGLPKLGRPFGSKAKPKPETEKDRNELHLKMQKVHNVTSGVAVTWLEKVFRLPRYKVEAALRDCPILRTAQNGGKIYDLKTAAGYLVEPTTDLDAFLQTIKVDKLPERLRETFWNAKIKEAKYRVMAGDLWPTESVIEVLGETFKTIKKTTQLWADTIEESEGLSDKQRDLLAVLVDRLQDDLHKALIEQARSNATESFLKNLDGDDASPEA